MKIDVWFPEWKEYELIDSGNYKKLERFGENIIIRDDPKAWWDCSLPESTWNKSTAIYTEKAQESSWSFADGCKKEWVLRLNKLKFVAQFTRNSKHVGVFPEQHAHWMWIQDRVANANRPLKVLNLFGYTGIASIVAAAAGAQVTHVDASKSSINWAKANIDHSGIPNNIRWMIDDAFKFVLREAKRGQKYDAIIMDPPSFGRGPKGELWKIEEKFPLLMKACKDIISDRPNFIIINMYSLEQSSLIISNFLSTLMQGHKGKIELGELAINQSNSNLVLPMSIFGRWVAL